ncbi:MAG: hypothetical protein J6S71_08220 [Clostridia bacterium]|nr:hypothetical protein [Clostridia bacterium]
MIRFSLLQDPVMYIPEAAPKPPKVEGPDLTNGETIVFLILVIALTIAAFAFTAYFYRKIGKQASKDKIMLQNNMKSESEVVINGKQNIHS